MSATELDALTFLRLVRTAEVAVLKAWDATGARLDRAAVNREFLRAEEAIRAAKAIADRTGDPQMLELANELMERIK